MWEFVKKLFTAILGSAATVAMTQGANQMFGPRGPSRRSLQQDIQMQRQAVEPIRTPEQTTADQMAVAQSQERMATFRELSKEYEGVKARGPVWNPFEETRIKEEAMGEAAGRGMAESGQAQEHVKRRLEEHRLGRAGLHQQELSNLRSQMLPYSNVQAPSQPPVFTPQIAQQPRTPERLFTTAPFDLTNALAPDKKQAEEKAIDTYGRPPEERWR